MEENKRDKAERLITKYLVDHIADPELPEALMLAIHDIRKVKEIKKIVKEAETDDKSRSSKRQR